MSWSGLAKNPGSETLLQAGDSLGPAPLQRPPPVVGDYAGAGAARGRPAGPGTGRDGGDAEPPADVWALSAPAGREQDWGVCEQGEAAVFATFRQHQVAVIR